VKLVAYFCFNLVFVFGGLGSLCVCVYGVLLQVCGVKEYNES
jgi:hypothetical protein